MKGYMSWSAIYVAYSFANQCRGVGKVYTITASSMFCYQPRNETTQGILATLRMIYFHVFLLFFQFKKFLEWFFVTPVRKMSLVFLLHYNPISCTLEGRYIEFLSQ